MNIYAISIIDNVNEDELGDLLEKISVKKRNKIGKFKFFDDKKRSIYGELILRHALVHDFRIVNEQIIIEINKNGKPYLKENDQIYFNISHSGEYVVCAIDSRPIGVDIELIDKADTNVAKKFLLKVNVNTF